MSELEERVTTLQEQIRREHDALNRIDTDDPSYEPVLAKLLKLAGQLLEIDDQIATNREEAQRHIRKRLARERTVRRVGWAVIFAVVFFSAVVVLLGWWRAGTAPESNSSATCRRRAEPQLRNHAAAHRPRPDPHRLQRPGRLHRRRRPTPTVQLGSHPPGRGCEDTTEEVGVPVKTASPDPHEGMI
jgi:cytochrome c-type biogenesis protein CcmH/NrfG